MATVTIRIKNNNLFLGDNTTEVKFKDVSEPLTADDLIDLFIRFALACGYDEISVATSLVGKGNELLPPEMQLEP